MHCKRIATAVITLLAASAFSHAAIGGETTLAAKIFVDVTNIDFHDSDIERLDVSDTGLDVKRVYLIVDHTFDDVWSANLTTDFQYLRDAHFTNFYVKKAYLQGKFSKAAVFRVGSADLPWIPFVESYYGYRYVEKTIVDRLKFGTSADWGLHLGGEAGENGAFKYATSVVNGAGYQHPARTASLGFAGRIGFAPIKGMIIAVGGYSGKLGNDRDAAATYHTATRTDLMIAYAGSTFRAGVEYFHASNWLNVLTVASDTTDGWSTWGSASLNDRFSVFARYDRANLSNNLDRAAENAYSHAGIEYQVSKGFKLAAVYKHGTTDRTAGSAENDNLHTANLRTNEIGLWAEVKF